MATGIQAVLTVGVILFTTLIVALWAFRPRSYRSGPRARLGMGIITTAWVILLPVGAAVLLSLSADALTTKQPDAWQGVLTGTVAVACWPVAVLALRKRRANHRNR